MLVPTCIFLDTNVYDRSKYIFDCTYLQPLVELAEKEKLRLLDPEVCRLEVLNHIKAKAEKAVALIRKAQNEAPVLRKWQDWPIVKRSAEELRGALFSNITEEYYRFIELFEVVNLGSDNAKLQDIVKWYNSGRAPFGDGRKKCEFPDAIALSSIANYTEGDDVSVAIISSDKDMKMACELHENLFWYESPANFAASFLDRDENLEKVRDALGSDLDLLEGAISELVSELGMVSYGADIVEQEELEVECVKPWMLTVVAIGDREATISFDSEVEFNAVVRIDVSDEDGMGFRTCRCKDRSSISGVVKMRLGDDWSKFTSIVKIELAQTELEVDEETLSCHDW